MSFSYDRWIDEQHEQLRRQLDERGRRSGYTRDVAAYALPSAGAEAGRLVLSDDSVPGCDVIRFPAQGTAIMAVPRSHLRGLLWTACRSAPICPTA
jgi:hypothetical protein